MWSKQWQFLIESAGWPSDQTRPDQIRRIAFHPLTLPFSVTRGPRFCLRLAAFESNATNYCSFNLFALLNIVIVPSCNFRGRLLHEYTLSKWDINILWPVVFKCISSLIQLFILEATLNGRLWESYGTLVFCPFVVYEAAGDQEERDGHYYIKIFPYAISMLALV